MFFILDIFDIPRSEIASGNNDEQEDQSTTITETSHVTPQAPQAPELPTPVPETTTPKSSGAYIQDTHRETSLKESPVPSTPAETVNEDDSVVHISGEMPTQDKEDAHPPHARKSEPANNPAPVPARTPDIKSALTISSQPPQDAQPAVNNPPASSSQPLSQDSHQAESKPTTDSLVVTEQPAKIVRPQHDQPPQGTHVSQLVYMHQQQDIVSKPTPKAIIAVAPGKMEAGSKFLSF